MSAPPKGPGTESTAVTRRAGVVALGTLLSRILGAWRDSVIAAHFPVAATDAFFVAFTIPNALRQILGEGAVSSAFVPVYTEVYANEGEERGRTFFANLSGVFYSILCAVTLLGMIFAPAVVMLYASGYHEDAKKFELTVSLTRLVFPYIAFMGAAALGMGVLNARKLFFVPAFAPGLLNVAMVAAPALFIPTAVAFGWSPIASLAVGALVGGVLQVVAQFPALKSIGMLGFPRFNWRDPYVQKALKLLGPLVLGLGVYQINLILSRQLASYLPEGSQSFLYYGSRVVDLPQGVFALALGTAALPSLAEARNRGDHEEVKRLFRDALRLSLFVAVPATVMLVVLAEPTITVLFARHEFTHALVMETTRSLVCQALGIWAVATVRIVVPVFYAYNDTRSPVLGSALNLVVFGVTALSLLGPWKHVGIATAISLATVVQLITLLSLLRRRIGALQLGEVGKSVLRILAACAGMALVARYTASFGHWENGGNDVRNIVVFAAALIASGVTYLGTSYLLRAPELADVLKAVQRKRKRA